MMETTYTPLNHTDLTEQTYEVLKESILRRQIKPGEKISVEEVARALGVSRTPVMDALKRLAGDGLVEIIPRRGTFVTELTAKDVAELFDIRLMIELYAAQWILRAGAVAKFLDSVREPMRLMEHSIVNNEYGDYEVFIQGDRKLHLNLVQATGNQRLIQMYTGMNVHMQVARAHYLRLVENAYQAHQDHEAILRAFKGGDEKQVHDAIHSHITKVKERILELLNERDGKL